MNKWPELGHRTFSENDHFWVGADPDLASSRFQNRHSLPDACCPMRAASRPRTSSVADTGATIEYKEVKLSSKPYQLLLALRHWLQTRPPTPPATKAQRATIDAILFSLASIGAVAAYTFQPLQRFAPPQGLLTGGLLLVFALAPLVAARHIRAGTGLVWAALPLLVMAIAILVVTARDAFKQNDWNNRRCWRIQQAMLKPSSATRSDLPGIFAALACPPQGSAPADINYHPSAKNPPDLATIRAHKAFIRNALDAEVQIERPGPSNKADEGLSH